MPEITHGTPVYLKSGSPVMTVTDVLYHEDEPLDVEVVYFDEQRYDFKYVTLPIATLSVAETKANVTGD